MVITYKKGETNKLSDEYNSTHFDCHCVYPQCTETLIDDDLVSGLDKLALIFPIIKINSGFRCAPHNAKVGGKPGSQHLYGKAADVETPFASTLELKNAAEAIAVFSNGGIGLYPTWVHVDVRGVKARW